MEIDNKPTMLTRMLSAGFFFVLTMSFLSWFFASAVELYEDLNEVGTQVVYDEGSMYMLGASIGLLSLLSLGIYQGVLGRDVSKNLATIVKWIVLLSIIVMFVFPPVMHHYVQSHIEKHGYTLCEKMSYQWVLYKKYVYTDKHETCDNLVKLKITQ